VPLLGELPVIGSLFRYTSRSRVKTNLMVFLRPTLVRDERGAEALSGERYEYILGEQRAAQPPSRPLLPDMTGPQLPPRKPAP
jgi:general secretion pathway protein D